MRNARRAASREGQAGEQETTKQPTEPRPRRRSAPAFANANAEFVDAEAPRPKTPPDRCSADKRAPLAQPAAQAQATNTQPKKVELVSADQFNDLDRAAWDANQMPKLMQLTGSNSHAEFRDDDLRWAQTSTIGKFFVAFGALLTIGSAIRMFMA